MARSEDKTEKWYIVDAEGQVVGRLASRVASLIKGKRSADYTPHVNPRIHVIVTNADKAVFTSDKLTTKIYYHHTRFRTGIKAETAGHLLERKPEEVLRRAIHGMLPKNRLGKQMDKHVRIFASGQYNGQHAAQKPETITIETRGHRKARA